MELLRQPGPAGSPHTRAAARSGVYALLTGRRNQTEGGGADELPEGARIAPGRMEECAQKLCAVVAFMFRSRTALTMMSMRMLSMGATHQNTGSYEETE